MKKVKLFFLVFLFVVFLSNCSLRSIVAEQLKPVVDEMQTQVLNESEESLVSESLPFAIKFAESLYYYYPNYYYYSSKLTLLYSAYAFAYIDETPLDEFDELTEAKIARVNYLYDKAIDYGLKSLDRQIPGFSENILKKKDIKGTLAKVKKEHLETLFWFNFAWAMRLFNDLSDTSRLIHLETMKQIAERIIEIDEDYLYGASYAILIAFYGGRTASLGGDLNKANEYYALAEKAAANKSIISDFVYFRFVSILQPNDALFLKSYEKIRSFDVKQNRSFAFVNTFLKRKAKSNF